jgi:superfamily II DNA or RNA helicase
MAPKARTSLTSLERLERQLLPITPDRAQGDAWEKALKGWINAGGHPELTKAWMWGEWPGKLKAGLKGDKGVDLVAETRDKQLVAIQVKFRRDPNDPVTAPEVQKLVGSYRKHFTLFALASNAWSATRGVSEAVGDEDAMLILREQLLESSYDWAAKKSIKRTKFTPFPFQKAAAENVRKALAKGGRAQIVMACGTGKTVTMLLAAEALDAQRVLVLAPTLLLVKQLRDEWISKRRPDREWASLAVCSDIGDGVDASEIAPAEFGAPPTTNPDDIAAFLKKPGRRVVFGTYASSDRIAKAQKKAGVPSFDLAVADEAHRIAGVVSAKDKSERSQRVMLEEKEIKAVRRLFATATPRITGSKKTRDGDEILIESMDDESRFGKVAHSVTFQEAVKLKRLVPYKLVVTIVTNDEVADAVQNRRFIDVNGKPYAADEVATAIAIRRAYKDLGISKIISYHSRVAGARAFADLITQVPGRGKSPITEHVAGSMPVNDRKQVLHRLAAATEPYLVTNARCLTEGIDVPALDAVAFADPRKSQVDIVQAVGRAMRRPMGQSKKTTGYIILPVYLTKKELKVPETAVEGSAFEPVLQVLRALKDHDPFMARFMAKILVAKGKKPHQKPRGIDEILEVSSGAGLDKEVVNKLSAAVQLRAIEVTADTFEKWHSLLNDYRDANGHTRVPPEYKIASYSLGKWVENTRSKRRRGELSAWAVSKLDEIAFDWEPHQTNFAKGMSELNTFYKRLGHARVPQSYLQNGFALGTWVAKTRSKKTELNPEQLAALEAVGFIWNPRNNDFEIGVASLHSFLRRTGHARVPQQHVEDGFRLGTWVSSCRGRKSRLSKQEIASLDSLGFVWNDRGAAEEKKFAALERYIAQHGNADVPSDHVQDGVKLGMWIRSLKKNPSNREARDRLKSLGVSLAKKSPRSESFELYLALLQAFVAREGHASVPYQTVESGYRLGSWVSRTRTKRARLLPQERMKLDSLGFDWEGKEGVIKAHMDAFRAFLAREHHSNVPKGHVEAGLKLGNWLRGIRTGDRNISAEHIAELVALGFQFSPHENVWDEMFRTLETFVMREGHANVPNGFIESGKPLRTWVVTQRAKRNLGTLTAQRIAKLDALGFVWDALAARFETKLSALKSYYAREGHTKMPRSFMEGDVALGKWMYNLRKGVVSVTPELRMALDSIDPNWVDS